MACASCGKPNAPGYGECDCGEPEPGPAKAKTPEKTEPKKATPSAKKADAKKVKCEECGKENAANYKFCKGLLP